VVVTLEVIMRRLFKLPVVLAVTVLLTLGATSIGASPWGREPGVQGARDSDPASVRADQNLAARIDHVAGQLLGESSLAGFSVAVARRGTVVFAAGYGFADLRAGVPASADTVYGIGSITKQFTAAAILQLQEDGKLALDDDIHTYLPGYPTNGQKITIRQLLSHTSGVPELTAQPSYSGTSDAGTTREALMREVLSLPLDFRPGTEWRYSNSGYVLAGMILERVTGLSYDAYLTNEVLGPLGIRNVSVCPDDRSSVPYARGYEPQTGSWTRAIRLGRPLSLVPAKQVDMEIASSAGAGCSTVIGLLAWTEALKSGRVISPASFRLMTTPTTLADGSTFPYGLGLFLRKFGTHRAVVHGGIIENGFVGMLADFPDDGLTVAVLANTFLPDPEPLMVRILGAVFNESDTTWDVPELEPSRT
jgi:CubicO group peptidase (beta-lactamase class C family)